MCMHARGIPGVIVYVCFYVFILFYFLFLAVNVRFIVRMYVLAWIEYMCFSLKKRKKKTQ